MAKQKLKDKTSKEERKNRKIIKNILEKIPVDEKKLKIYNRNKPELNLVKIKTKLHKKKFQIKEKKTDWALEQAARAEILLTEIGGGLEPEAGETSTQFTQKEIIKQVDITSASKYFELQLPDFGSYRVKFTRNGRHLLLGGKKGHVAAFDYQTKKLHCEINVMESVHDISWLHLETMFAVAQKNWVYVYDNQGTEIHCVKRLNRVLRMEFLPYHFLLATCSEEGFLSWLDISLGEIVAQYNSKCGRLSMMCQNPYNAILCLGHAKGNVTMWSPNVNEPLVKMLCHKAPMSALAVNTTGVYMATADVNRNLKIWDIRQYKGPVQYYKLRTVAGNLCFSQNDYLGIGMQNVCEIYRNCCTETATRAYLRHKLNHNIENIQFCPYEDVLGIGTTHSLTSIIVPGAGEANFDAYEANPYQTKSQRREAEVKALLEKIQPEFITLNPTSITEVDIPTLEDKIEAKKELLYIKPPKIEFVPKNKAKKRGTVAKKARNKQIVKDQFKKKFINMTQNAKNEILNEKSKKNSKKQKFNVLNRFKTKK